MNIMKEMYKLESAATILQSLLKRYGLRVENDKLNTMQAMIPLIILDRSISNRSSGSLGSGAL